MLALSIGQPYAELILRGIKTAELRSRGTTILGEHFYSAPPLVWAKGVPSRLTPVHLPESIERVTTAEPLLLVTRNSSW